MPISIFTALSVTLDALYLGAKMYSHLKLRPFLLREASSPLEGNTMTHELSNFCGDSQYLPDMFLQVEEAKYLWL